MRAGPLADTSHTPVVQQNSQQVRRSGPQFLVRIAIDSAESLRLDSALSAFLSSLRNALDQGRDRPVCQLCLQSLPRFNRDH